MGYQGKIYAFLSSSNLRVYSDAHIPVSEALYSRVRKIHPAFIFIAGQVVILDLKLS